MGENLKFKKVRRILKIGTLEDQSADFFFFGVGDRVGTSMALANSFLCFLFSERTLHF